MIPTRSPFTRLKIAFRQACSTCRRVLPLIIENSLRAFLRGDRKALREWVLPLRLKYILHRLRVPRHPSVSGKILLLLDPVQYELAPQLRFCKATTLRQKLVHALVKCIWYVGQGRTWTQPECKVDESDAVLYEILKRSIRESLADSYPKIPFENEKLKTNPDSSNRNT